MRLQINEQNKLTSGSDAADKSNHPAEVVLPDDFLAFHNHLNGLTFFLNRVLFYLLIPWNSKNGGFVWAEGARNE